jgi:hypothetical protein
LTCVPTGTPLVVVVVGVEAARWTHDLFVKRAVSSVGAG